MIQKIQYLLKRVIRSLIRDYRNFFNLISIHLKLLFIHPVYYSREYLNVLKSLILVLIRRSYILDRIYRKLNRLIFEFELRIDIYMKKMVTDELIADDDTDSPDIGLVIKGSFNQIWGFDSASYIQILFTIDDIEQFSFRSYPRYGNPKIVMSENRDNEAILRLDPYDAFYPISRESIEEAELSSDKDGQPILIISSDKNRHLYENLLYRISKSARVLVH